MDSLRYKIMGPLEVFNGSDWVGLSAPKWRAALALLIINRNRTVSMDQLVDELWGRDLPSAPVKAIQVYVSRIRRVLNDKAQERLLSSTSGYRLVFDHDELDANLFEELARRARAERANGRLQASIATMRRALGLYRGPALVGVSGTNRIAAEAARLEEMRLSALQDYIDTRFIVGELSELIAELRGLTFSYPLNEGYWARLMLALCRMGRQADALETYLQARKMLVEQFGVEPGLELRQAHDQVLHSSDSHSYEPSPKLGQLNDVPSPALSLPVTPRQLPPAVSGFAGRANEMRQLDRMLSPSGDTQPLALRIVLIIGQAGVGKSAFAKYWSHSVVNHFPQGQLYADFSAGNLAGPVGTVQTLRQFITALSSARREIPETLEEQAALYRSMLFGKRILVLLDNVRDSDQIRSLLPGSADCFVIVTARKRLIDLTDIDGARVIQLDGLRYDEATELLSNVMGSDWVDADPETIRRLIRENDGRPAALRQAANLHSVDRMFSPGTDRHGLAREHQAVRDIRWPLLLLKI